jgi:hypothetical protein
MAVRACRIAALAVVLATAVHAQPADTGDTRPVPRTAAGKPDLSGIWIATAAVLLFEGEEAFAAARAEDAAAGRPPGTSNTPPPYRPEAEERRQYFLGRLGIDDPMARCLLTGVPRINFRPLPFEIVQQADRVIMLYEIHHAFRIIPTDGRSHPADMEPSYLGDSVGHWEGDTLVVDVVGFNDKTWLTGVGTLHSENLRVTERYTRDSYNTIRYEVTMDDPEMLTKPYTVTDTFRLRPNERIREYECLESNEDLLRFEQLLEKDAVVGAP